MTFSNFLTHSINVFLDSLHSNIVKTSPPPKVENLLATSSSRGLAIIYQLPTCNMSTGPGLESLVDQTISVITNDGRNIVGVLKGFDQATNIILDESHERVYSTKFLSFLIKNIKHFNKKKKFNPRSSVQQLVLGLYIIRGDNISIVGELDEELDSSLDLSKLRAHPLKPVTH
ncbi:hypothetical protein AAG906_007590 [Vitis piasezkii]